MKGYATHVLCIAAAGSAVVGVASAARGALVGATPYTNLLSSATDFTYGRNNDPTGFSLFRSPYTRALDGGVGGYGQSDVVVNTPESNNGPAFMEWALPVGSTFTARTFITQTGNTYPTFVGASPYQLVTDSGAGGALVDVPGHSTPGTAQTSPIVITNPGPVTARRVRFEFDQWVTTEGFAWGVVNEVIAVEDELQVVEIADAQASSQFQPIPEYDPERAFDGEVTHGWAASDTAPGHTLTLTLAEPSDLGAIWVTGVDGRDEKFDITFKDELGATVGSVTGVEWSGVTNAALLKLDGVVPDVSTITLTMTGTATAAAHYIGEVVPFTIVPVPEPTALSLLALTAVPLLARRRQA